ncbi:dihydroorotase [Pendulispora rubella]|uniref:Dihydroorotase n=1 Tax=Pendulispora rubella TaxID=2741070 RepID=A0ABZ2LCS8_9BACT
MERLIVFRHVRAIDPSSSLDAIIDVVIENDRIVRLGPNVGAEAAKAEWAQVIAPPPGAWLLPGLVDLHAHLREPGQESKEDIRSGLGAAAAGGFTDVCAMPNTVPVNDSRMVTEAMLARAHDVGGPRLHPIGAITMGQRGEALTEMGDLREAGAVAVSDDGRCVTSSSVMRRALEYASVFDMPVIQHAEDHALTEGSQMHEGSVSTKLGLRGWPRVAEDIIVARDLMLAEYTGARYHVAHASTEGTVRLLREAKSRGLRVSAEVTPHHLLLTHEAVGLYDTACKVNPPLREEHDVQALREGLADGTIDAVATDHAPHGILDKHCEFAEAKPGMIGLELCLPLLLGLVEQGALPLNRLVESLTHAPSSIARLPDKRIREGARADLVLIDPEERWTIEASRLRSKSKNTPFMGRNVKGRVKMTLVAGNIVFNGGS